MKQLIDNRGQLQDGVFAEPVDDINYLDYDLRTVMDRPRLRLARRWRFNQFQFISAVGADWLFGLAIVDLKLVSSAFFYLFDFKTGEMKEQSLIQPLARHTRIDSQPETGSATFRKGDTHIQIDAEANRRRLTLVAPDGVQVGLDLAQDNDPLRMASRAGYNGWVFTRKSAGLPVTGEVHWADTSRSCNAATFGSIDWSCGFMRRETAWNWACLSGQLVDGRTLGLNLAAGVNETGVTENALWLNGRCLKLDMARFEFDRYNPDACWQVTTTCGRVALKFRPAGVRKERLNAWVLASNFRQYVGTFDGVIYDANNASIPIEGLRGLVEDHFARW